MTLLSFGEIIWDIYRSGVKTLGGAPLNFASYVSLFGNRVYLASAVGEDALGDEALVKIKELGIYDEYVSRAKNKATGQCRISLDKNKVPSYNILEDVAYDYIVLPDKLASRFDAVAFGTLALRGEYNRTQLKKLLTDNRFSEIYTDLNIRAPFYSEESIVFCLSNATIVKISDEELPLIAKLLWHTCLDTQDAVPFIAEKYPQIKLLLITCGAKGAFCYDRLSGKTYYSPAKTVPVVSTVGAGDSFGATFLTMYDKTKNIPYALEAAAKVSAFVVAHSEAVPPDIKDFLKNSL